MNDERTRSFIAIELPEETKRRLTRLEESFRQTDVRASWVRESTRHLSLRFLGDISTTERNAIEAGLAEACAAVAPFQLVVADVGVFPNPRAPRVLWAGVAGDVEPLHSLAAMVEEVARGAGLDALRTRYTPHITLARIRNPAAAGTVESWLSEHNDFAGGAIPVERVSLFASELRPYGANHTLLRSFTLGTHD